MSKVIFLDIDGPMIPSSMFLVDRMCSWHRVFPATTVAVVQRLCEQTGAKIVFNTTHNLPFDGVDDIDVALTKQGLSRDHILAADFNTKYPDIERGLAVKEWLGRHPEVTDWIALDDVRFTDDERLILVDSDTGVTLRHLNAGVEKLGGQPIYVLI